MSTPPQVKNKTGFKKDVLLLGDMAQDKAQNMAQIAPTTAFIDVLRDEFRKTLLEANFQDKLTNLYNKNYFDKAFNELWLKQQQSKGCLSLIFCDIDYLKSYNNVYGYQLGNQVLQLFAQQLDEKLKAVPDSILTRYGADCFAILLPNALIDDALMRTEVIQKAIKDLAIPNSTSLVSSNVTASFGIASTYPQAHHVKEAFFENAKEALYQAKVQGRNAAYTLPPAWSQESMVELTHSDKAHRLFN